MVSICVPIYNTEKYLKRSIESLLNQTYTDIEVVLVNDGSTDQSGEICEEFKRQDIRVKVVHQANGGEASARNAGLRAAIGEYICFMDSDDEYYPEAIESMLEVLEENDADLSFGGYIETGAHGTHFAIAHTLEYTKEDIAGEMLKWGCPYGDSYIFSTVNGKLFKASLIKENNLWFEECFVVGNDSIFFGNYIKKIKKAVNTFSPVYKYYKYDPAERLQGMGWKYPDDFILLARLQSIVNEILLDDNKNAKIVYFMKLIRGLSKLALYESTLNVDLGVYVAYCRQNIPCFSQGAQIEVNEKVILEKNKWGIPFGIVSLLITENRDAELVELLRLVQRFEKLELEETLNVRKMIKL